MPARKFLSFRYTQRLLTMSSILRPLFLWKAMSRTPLAQVFTACIAAVGGRLPRRLAIEGDVALQ